MKNFLYWTIAVIITLSAAVYQRMTGPTYEKSIDAEINGTEYSFDLTRSHGGEKDCEVILTVADKQIGGKVYYRLYPSNNSWTEKELVRNEDVLIAILPHQPPVRATQAPFPFWGRYGPKRHPPPIAAMSNRNAKRLPSAPAQPEYRPRSVALPGAHG